MFIKQQQQQQYQLANLEKLNKIFFQIKFK